MRLLLDENLDTRLAQYLPGHQVDSVTSLGWKGKRNGILLKMLEEAGYDAFVTADKGIQHQHNFNNYTVPVLILRAPTTKIKDHIILIMIINELLKGVVKPGPMEIWLPNR